jgi:hypothetical protein
MIDFDYLILYNFRVESGICVAICFVENFILLKHILYLKRNIYPISTHFLLS